METMHVKMVFESYVIRNEDGVGRYRTSTREGAERELSSLREYYERHSLPFKPSITKERAIVECEAVKDWHEGDYSEEVEFGGLIIKPRNKNNNNG